MTRLLVLLALGVLAALPLRAQPTLFDAATLDALFDQPPRVEVNLGGSLLRIAASADDDPDTSNLLRGLRGITVRVYALDAARTDLRSRLDGFGRRLASDGWQTMVRVRPSDEDTDDVSIFVREVGDTFDGMVVMALDEAEGDASFVFLDGPIDLARISDLSDRFAGTDLDEAQQEAMQARDEAMREMDQAHDEAMRAAEEAHDEAMREHDEAMREHDEAMREAERARGSTGRGRPGLPPAAPVAPAAPPSLPAPPAASTP